MISLIINTADISSQFNVTQKDIEGIVDFAVKDVTSTFARLWDNQARNNLGSTRQRYRESLQVVDEGRMQGSVILWYNDKLIPMIEEGAGAFDMKQGFANSDKKKTKADGGWYMRIPFRFATPSALGEEGIFSAKMPDEIYQLVKDKPTDIVSSMGGNRSVGLGLAEIPKQFTAPNIRPSVSSLPESKTFEQYKNKSSIYEGLHKRKDSTTGQNVYMSFRTVSDTSDADAFIHTGINAYNLADKALADLESNIEFELGKSVDNALKNYGFL